MAAVRAIELSSRRMAVVVAADGKLLGTLTDGDIRRHLLGGGGLEDLVAAAMNRSPITATVASSEDYLKDLMRRGNVVALPLLDKSGRYSRLIHLIDLIQDQPKTLPSVQGFDFAVIMAGGEGTRLRPYTEYIPKPMVKIGGAPLLERQIRQLIQVGITRVYISINYLGNVIENYFGDGHSLGIEICYLREEKKLGTAGALSLLPEQPVGPILVMNGDILTTSSFESLYAFHQTHESKVTIAAIDHRVDIPYGVIRATGISVTDIVEKPSERFLCNAGIYAISSDVLPLIPRGGYKNMTDFIDLCLAKKMPISVFPLHEYWTDIGTPEDLIKAREYFSNSEVLR